MGIMGATTVLMSRGCAPRASKNTSLTRRLSFCVADTDLDLIQFKENCDGHGLKSVDDEVEEVLSEWWGCREVMQRTESVLGDEGEAAPILGLPDDVMTLIFARLPRKSLAITRLVCSSWKRVAEQQELASLRRKMGVAEGWIYVLAETPQGSPFRAYDPIAAKWSALPPTPGCSQAQQWQGFACVALGHKFLLIGGTRTQRSPTDSDRYSSASAVCSDVVIYDSLTNKWTKGANMTTPRSWFAAAVVGDKVYVAGGQGNTKFLDSAEVYDPSTDRWTKITSMAVVRSSCQGFSLGGQFWVIAGEYVKNQHVDRFQKSSAEVYDAETGTWRFVSNMYLDDNKVMEPSTVTANGELVCVHQKRIMAYKKDSNTWTQLGHISGGEEYARPCTRFGFACESVGSNLYIIGGTREYSQNRYRYCMPLNTVEVCELDWGKQYSSQLGWKLGADMGKDGGVISASLVSWL
ncbi:hypothetical protein M758_11G155300 [Ceratodon purpureus]|nr:hypothetical protein M758_11G155300 [Ceratodon purpureus]